MSVCISGEDLGGHVGGIYDMQYQSRIYEMLQQCHDVKAQMGQLKDANSDIIEDDRWGFYGL